MWADAEDVAAAAGVPVDWVPTEWATLDDEALVDRIEARLDEERALMILRRSPFWALTSKP